MRLPLYDGEIDLQAGEVRRAGVVTLLSSTESRFLTYLAEHPDTLIDVEELQQNVWSMAPHLQTRAIYFAVRRLRKILEIDPKNPITLMGSERSGFGLRIEPPSTSLIGRQKEFIALCQQLEAPGAMVILSGPAGVGKSSLLTELTKEKNLIPIDVAGITDETELAYMICHSLGDTHPPHPLVTVGNLLAVYSGAGIALDHMDDLKDSAVAYIRKWRQAAPQLKWLLTSRTSPLLPKASYFPLAPLGLIDARLLFRHYCEKNGVPPPLQEQSLDDLLLCLDGIPLAIEIGAWQARTLPLQQIKEGLIAASKTVGLTGPPGSLETSIAMSWNRLTEDERSSLARLCDLEVAVPLEAALATMGTTQQILSKLVEHGLLRIEISEKGNLYTSFYIVKWFVHLRSGRSDGCERLAQWWFEFEKDPRAKTWVGFATHAALLKAALYLIQKQNIVLGAPLASVCLRHGFHYGMTSQHELLAEKALQLPIDDLTRARLELLRKRFNQPPEEIARNVTYLKQSLPEEEFLILMSHAIRALSVDGNLAAARQVLAEAKSLNETHSLQLSIETAYLARTCGMISEAVTLAEQIFTQAYSEPEWKIPALRLLATLRSDQGLHEEAYALSTEALSLVQGSEAHILATAWFRHAIIAQFARYFSDARTAYIKARQLCQTIASPPEIIIYGSVINQVFIEFELQALDRAKKLLIDHISFVTKMPRISILFRLLIELINLREGQKPSSLSIDHTLAILLPAPALDEISIFGYCAEVAWLSNSPEKANLCLTQMANRIQQIGLSAQSEGGRQFTRLQSLIMP